ncbi:MAG: hypothetical protein QXP97_07355 [Desulfurococcus sp.]|jgi:hypothetical protein
MSIDVDFNNDMPAVFTDNERLLRVEKFEIPIRGIWLTTKSPVL